MSFASITGKLIQAATGRAYRRFLKSLEDPARAQRGLLRRLVEDSSRSEYGRAHELSPTDDVAAFRSRIPMVTYEDLQPWVERAVFKKEAGIFSPAPVVRVEATSGSSSKVKWIPYSRPMMRTFNRMFTLWSHDLLESGLYQPRSGKLFMCVTGGRPDDQTLSREQVGDDRDYLGKTWRTVLDRFVIAPEFNISKDPIERLAHVLEQERELEVMSFWSPSLLLSVLDHMGVSTPGETRQLWPNLQLISCWKAASSRHFADRLSDLFPGTVIQGKGLLATEAALTIPIERAGGCLPLLDDVYLEFVAADGSILGLDEIEDANEYEVLISNRAGFLRYRLGDRVKVGGFFGNTPLLEFIGRAGVVSDLVGEKLCLEFVLKQWAGVIEGYHCLLPAGEGYELWIDAGTACPDADKLEALLCESFHYARARQLGQLRPLRVKQLDRLDDRIRAATEDQGGRARAFKPPMMIADRSLAETISRTLRRRLPEAAV